MLKITLLPDGDGYSGFELGNNALPRGPGTKDINNFLPSLDAVVRERRAFRGAAVENLPQESGTFLESFVLNPEIEYGFANEDAKAAFILELQKNVPPVANVELLVGNSRFYLLNARLRPPPIVTVMELETALRLRFTISGGLIVTDLPAV